MALTLGLGCIVSAPIGGADCSVALGHLCPEPFICLNGTCKLLTGPVPTGCAEDDDCLGPTPACFLYGSVGICVQCNEAYPCAIGQCKPQSGYTCGCDGNSDCAQGSLICNEFGICTSCHLDSQCDPGWLCDQDQNKCVYINDERP